MTAQTINLKYITLSLFAALFIFSAPISAQTLDERRNELLDAMLEYEKADITKKELLEAMLKYEEAAREKYNKARADEIFTKPPMQEESVDAARNIVAGSQDAMDNTDVGVRNELLKFFFPSVVTEADLKAQEQAFLEQQSGDVPASQAQSFNQMLPFLQQHLTYFCSEKEQELLEGCAASSTPGGDTNISYLLGPVNLGADPALDFAAKAFINSIVNPNPNSITKITKDALGDPVPVDFASLKLDRQTIAAKKYTAHALNSSVLNSLYSIYNMRLPNDELGGLSPLEVLEKEASRRANDPNWVTGLATTPAEGIMRELAQMEAFKLYMDYMKYRQAERTEAIMASLLAVAVQIQQNFASSTEASIEVTESSQ